MFLRLKPDWKAAQAEEVTASCTSDERDAFVAIADGLPVGFVTVALNAFNERMGVIEIIGVDPDFHRQGIASRLTEHALDHMRRCGMDIAAVGTGGDPGHAPARATYEALGFTLLPSARYLKQSDRQARGLHSVPLPVPPSAGGSGRLAGRSEPRVGLSAVFQDHPGNPAITGFSACKQGLRRILGCDHTCRKRPGSSGP